METIEKINVTVETIVNAPIETVWDLFTDSKHIIHWNNASDDWHTPWAQNDFKTGGSFIWRMEARDGSNGFDFSGKYLRIEPYHHIEYVLDDGRKVKLDFFTELGKTRITETFETEHINSVNQQRAGWQSILESFKKYVEKYGEFKILHFETTIDCDVEKVYKTMIDPEHFKEWTADFVEQSHFEGSWEKGARIRFLGINQNGATDGLVSRIKENIPNKFISIEHIGIIQNDKEIIRSESLGWKDLLENYSFSSLDGKTLLSVDVDSDKEFKSYFMGIWPKALTKLKEICERKS